MSVAGIYDYLELITNSKSGSFFFFSHDQKYIIKSMKVSHTFNYIIQKYCKDLVGAAEHEFIVKVSCIEVDDICVLIGVYYSRVNNFNRPNGRNNLKGFLKRAEPKRRYSCWENAHLDLNFEERPYLDIPVDRVWNFNPHGLPGF